MTSRERIDAALNFKEADRIAIHDSPWGTAIERWHQEGLPAEVGPIEYFGFEMVGTSPDLTMRLPTETIEETEEYRITRTTNGAVVKNWKHATSTPQTLDFLIKTPADWEEHKPRLEWSSDRVDLEAVRQTEKAAHEKGKWFQLYGAFGYDLVQTIIGSERLLIAMATEPEWVEDIFMTYARLIVTAGEELIGAGIEFDGAWVWDDMGYRNTSLFSPNMFMRYEFPAHKLVYDFFHSKELKVILHSCGCVKDLIPGLLKAGLDCLQPLEVKAGMDLIELKKKHGAWLAFMGGIDVRAMANPDPAVIEEEISSKISVAKKGGGYIYHSDHSVPDNVSFQQYCRVIDLVHKYGTY